MSEDGAPELVQVRILRLPVALWMQSSEHSDELIREFMLIVTGTATGEGHAVPHRLVQLVEEVTAQYGGFSEANEQRLQRAAAAGEAEIDLDYELPAGVDAAVDRLAELLDAADEYCRSGEHLLTLATPPEQLRFRHWFLGEFSRQVGGGAPIAWPDYAQS
jgi:hypothetical protein